MKTVLALDELLARALREEIPGSVQIIGRAQMRDDGDEIVKRAASGKCVLAIGGSKWDPLPWLERWRLAIPVVVTLPSFDDRTLERAARLRVFSVVPATMPGIVSCLADECVLAAASYRSGQALRPVIVVPPQRQQRDQRAGQVIAFRRPPSDPQAAQTPAPSSSRGALK